MPLTVLNVGYPFAPVSPKTAGGAEQILASLDKALVHAGHRSIVLALEGSRIYGRLLPSSATNSTLDVDVQQLVRTEFRKALQRALERFNVDIVHMHGVDFLEYLPSASVPLVVTLHLPLSWYPSEIFHLKRRSALVCVSASQARTRPTGTHIDAVIENGVVEEGHALSHLQSRTRKGKYVLSMGRICPEKGFHHALDAATEAHIPMLLAGSVFAYPDHQKYLREEIQPRLGKDHRLLDTVGGQPKRDLLAGAQCVLIPSRVNETSSLVAMEALACGTPVVAFRVGALPELIAHGRTGFLVDTVSEMASAISAAASLESAVCREEAVRRFSRSKMTQAYLDLYGRIVSLKTFKTKLSYEDPPVGETNGGESENAEIHEVVR